MAKKNDYWVKRLSTAQWNTYNDTNKYHKELVKLYREATDDILLELFKIEARFAEDGVISRSEFYRASHLKRMEEGFNKVLESLGEKVKSSGSLTILNAGEKLIGTTDKLLKETGLNFNYNKDLAKRMLQDPWHGSTFSKRVWKNTNGLSKVLNDTVKKGVMTGKSTASMAMDLTNTMNSKLYEASRLVRTETMHHLNEVNKVSMKEAGVTKVQEVVTLDERTSNQCSPHQGKIWDIDKAPILPRHPNCRCVLVPYIDVDKLAEEFDRRETKILFENGDIDEFEVAKRLGFNPLRQEEAIETMEIEARKWMSKLSEGELRSIKKYTGNGIDPDGTKLYEKINRYLWGTYNPSTSKELNTILATIKNILNSFNKTTDEYDLIAYRYQMPEYTMTGGFKGFLSTSIISDPVMGGNNPNSIIIVPKTVKKAYLDLISEYNQKELLIKPNVELDIFATRLKDDIILYIARE
ncbi:MAG: minor capsid protein [Tissierellia bacterium]|nr:minor capsid protein [Tissierellia bacterium]